VLCSEQNAKQLISVNSTHKQDIGDDRREAHSYTAHAGGRTHSPPQRNALQIRTAHPGGCAHAEFSQMLKIVDAITVEKIAAI
jgi:hypothetical protein